MLLKNFYQPLKQRLFKSDFAHKVIQTFMTQFVLLGINFLSAIFIARALGPKLRGIYAVAMAISSIGIQFGNLGLQSANTYYLAKDPKLLPAVIGNTVAISLGLGSLCSLVAWIFCVSDSGAEHLEKSLLYLTVFWIPLGITYMLFQNVLLGIHEVKAFNKSELLNRIFNFIVIFALILCGIRNVSFIFTINYLSIFLALGYIFRKIQTRVESKPYFSLFFLKRSIAYALRVYIGCLIAFFVIRCDILFVKHYFDFEQTGYYSVAFSAIDIISIFPMTIGTLLFPRLSAMECEKTKLHFLKKMGTIVFFIMTALSFILFLVAKPLILFIYGKEFLPVVPIFCFLLPGMVFIATDRICSSYFSSIGMPLIVIFSPLIALFVKVNINYFLVGSVGVNAIAISSSVGYILMFLMSLIYLHIRARKRVEEPQF